jgi:hypothetical protein
MGISTQRAQRKSTEDAESPRRDAEVEILRPAKGAGLRMTTAVFGELD